MLSLEDLGEDVVVSNLLPFLDKEDVFSLSLTCHYFRDLLTTNESYHQLYLKFFGSKPVPLNLEKYHWEELFRLRTSPRAKLYTWGSNDFNRLGNNSAEFFRRTVSRGINVPYPVETFNEKNTLVIDIIASGYSFQVLTNKGELYWTGNHWKAHNNAPPGPRTHDYDPPVARHAAPGRLHNFRGGRQSGILGLPGMMGRYRAAHIPQPPATLNNAAANDSSPAPAPATTTEEAPSTTHAETNPNLRLPPEEQINRLNLSSSNQPPAPEPGARPAPPPEPPKPRLPSYINTFRLPPHASKLVAISSGREHIVALDDSGRVFTWDNGIPGQGTMGVEVTFPGIAGPAKVTKISAGWNLSACYIENHGLVVWYSRSAITQQEHDDKSFRAQAQYVTVPGTDPAHNKIVDVMSGNDYVLYIKGNGKLYRYDIDARAYYDGNREFASAPFAVYRFNRWLAKHNQDIFGTGAKFSKVSGCYNNFAVFTDDGAVLLGTKARTDGDDDDEDEDSDSDADDGDDGEERGPQIIPELQNRRIRDVVMGDYHYMALTDDGELLSWGSESRSCGCLGLGKLDNNERINVPTPVKSPNPDKKGKWLAIAAAGWHSSGIFIETED